MLHLYDFVKKEWIAEAINKKNYIVSFCTNSDTNIKYSYVYEPSRNNKNLFLEINPRLGKYTGRIFDSEANLIKGNKNLYKN